MIKETLSEIKQLLNQSFPELVASLNPPAAPEKIKELEKAIGQPLPDDFKALYLLHDGESQHFGLFFGLPFISLNDVLAEWKTWESIVGETGSLDGSIISFHTGFIKENYANKNYIPISKDHGGNNIGIDLDPDEKGTRGQVINFGRDEEIRYVIANSITDFLKFILFHIKAGNYRTKDEEDEDGNKMLFLKEPANSHFLDTLKNLSLPFGQSTGTEVATEDAALFNSWYESISDTWKEIVNNSCNRNRGFSALARIVTLNLLQKNVNNLAPVEKFTGLRELLLSGNPVKDLSSLKYLQDLKILYLSQTLVEDITPLTNCKNLSLLNLNGLSVTNVSCLADLKKLRSLSIENTKITDLQSVGGLKNLTSLDISNNNFVSFEILGSLTNLIELKLANTNVADISFILSIKNLQRLTIYKTNVTDFTSLKSLDKLSDITCTINDFLKIKDMLPQRINFGISGGMSEEQRNIWSNYQRHGPLTVLPETPSDTSLRGKIRKWFKR